LRREWLAWGGVALTMPRWHYAAKFASGEIRRGGTGAGRVLAKVKAALARPSSVEARVLTVADLAAEALGTDWPGIVADRIGLWVASHFDMGQALWQASRGRSAFDSCAVLHAMTCRRKLRGWQALPQLRPRLRMRLGRRWRGLCRHWE